MQPTIAERPGTFTAEQAARALANIANEHIPESALARVCAFTDLQDEATSRAASEVDTILQVRGLVETVAREKRPSRSCQR